jgi:hypothetical protein
MVYIFILQKISPEGDRLQHFCTFALILAKFSAPMSSNFFLCKIWVITNSKSAANITWRVYWMRNRGLLLQTFCTLFTQLAILTYSALGAVNTAARHQMGIKSVYAYKHHALWLVKQCFRVHYGQNIINLCFHPILCGAVASAT